MKALKTANQRRNFIKQCGLSSLPFLLPTVGLHALPLEEKTYEKPKEDQPKINFVYDGLAMSPQDYLSKLTAINAKNPIQQDFYGSGGSTETLEATFAKLTGKEKAIYLPTGTMANQLALKLLSDNKTKVIVPENSHIFRDEADAAQSVHNKRLVPIGKGKPNFELNDLKEAIEYIENGEVFDSGIGAVAIENPVRRADGAFVPLNTVKAITSYCREKNHKTHLDGARLHLASAFANVSVAEYASYFDTVYISLYKYLNAGSGAMLCGDAELIDQIAHQIKILGGTMLSTWNNTAMALHYLNGIEERLQEMVKKATELVSQLNKIDGLSITHITNGTNIYNLQLADRINPQKFSKMLYNTHQIQIRQPNEQDIVKFVVNESLLLRDNNEIVAAFQKAAKEV